GGHGVDPDPAPLLFADAARPTRPHPGSMLLLFLTARNRVEPDPARHQSVRPRIGGIDHHRGTGDVDRRRRNRSGSFKEAGGVHATCMYELTGCVDTAVVLRWAIVTGKLLASALFPNRTTIRTCSS